MRKILYISGTRADYGLMRETLFKIEGHPKLKLEIVACGMHVMPKFGTTITEVEKDKFKIHKLMTQSKGDDKKSMARFIGNLILKLTEKVELIKPGIILTLGDRAEMLAAAIVGTYLMIPVVHIHGGDVTSTVDEVVRHAITKLSHIHLAATRKSAERIIKMGEEPSRVYVVGAPGLDAILNKKFLSEKEIARKFNLNPSKPIVLVVQHPVSAEIKNAHKQMFATMEAIRQLGYQSIVIYPNADAGGRTMIKVIERYRKYLFIQIYKNILRDNYLNLMKISSVMVGNSSSGIIEAPSLLLPVVNVGARQEARERSDNIIDVDYDCRHIKEAIKKSIRSKKIRFKIRQIKSPYGDGKTGERIARILSKIRIDKDLLNKRMAY